MTIQMIATIDGLLQSHYETCLCGNYGEMRVIAVGKESHLLEDDSFEIGIYKVVRCPNCQSILALGYSSRASDNELEAHYHYRKEEPFEFSFKRQLLYCSPVTHASEIPSPISEILNQAQSVVASSPRAAFILCRAVLEEVCRSHNIPVTATNKNNEIISLSLSSRLDKLISQEKLPKDLSLILHGIRQLGNEGAHGSQVEFNATVTNEDGEAIIGLLSFVLDRLYVDLSRSQKAMYDLDNLKAKVLAKLPASSGVP